LVTLQYWDEKNRLVQPPPFTSAFKICISFYQLWQEIGCSYKTIFCCFVKIFLTIQFAYRPVWKPTAITTWWSTRIFRILQFAFFSNWSSALNSHLPPLHLPWTPTMHLCSSDMYFWCILFHARALKTKLCKLVPSVGKYLQHFCPSLKMYRKYKSLPPPCTTFEIHAF